MITLMIASYRSFPQGGMVAIILNIWHTRVNLRADTVDADAPDAGNMNTKMQITG